MANFSVKEIDVLDNKLQLRCDWSAGIGGDLWTTGLNLCNHIEVEKSFYGDFFQNKRILELGSGTGLVGLFIGCVSPAKEIYLTDLGSHMPIIKHNIQLNHGKMKCPMKSAEYNWGTGSSHLGTYFDVIVATDVVYSTELYHPFVNALKENAHDHTLILLGVTKTDTDRVFFDLLKQANFVYYKIADDKVNPEGNSPNFGLFCVFYNLAS